MMQHVWFLKRHESERDGIGMSVVLCGVGLFVTVFNIYLMRAYSTLVSARVYYANTEFLIFNRNIWQ